MRMRAPIQMALLATMLATTLAHAQQSAQELFQSGLYAEEVQGNL